MTLLNDLASLLPVRTRLPKAFGRAGVFVDADWMIRRRYGSAASSEASILRGAMLVAPGDVIWDIGSQFGTFSVAAAARAGRAGRVVAIDSDPRRLSLLLSTARRLPEDFAQLTLAHLTVGSDVTLGRKTVPMPRGYSPELGKACQWVEPHVPLDWLLQRLPKPQVVRIGVPGARSILEGQSHFLHEVRPILVCASENDGAMASVLRAAAYVLYDAEAAEGGAAPIDWAAPVTFAMPRERKSDLLISSFQVGSKAK